jgi:ABC-2 type transport system ATP-binding protein
MQKLDPRLEELLRLEEKPVVEVMGVSKSFGHKVKAVENVSFSVHRGEIFGFLGPNGAGKTTTINMLTTQIIPSSGTAKVAGYDIRKQPNEVRRRISVVLQNNTADEELTGRENAQVIANLYGLPKVASRRFIQGILDLVELGEAADRLVRGYSGGMRRRLEIAIGLISRPKVLFLDEPTLGLDTQTREAIWSYIRTLRDRYFTTVFLTTHQMDEADQICDRIAIIDHGKIVKVGTPAEIKGVVGRDVIEFTLDVGSDELSQAVSQNTGAVVERDGVNYRLKVEKGEETIPSIIEFVASKGYPVRRVSLSKPSLAEAYLELTGRAFRESDQEAVQTARMINLFS